jgi:hypothetical protein
VAGNIYRANFLKLTLNMFPENCSVLYVYSNIKTTIECKIIR